MDNVPVPAEDSTDADVSPTTGIDKRRTVKVKAFGVEVELRGYDIIIVLVLGITIALGVATYYTSTANAAAHDALATNQKSRADKNEEQLSEVIYMLSLPEHKRQELRLDVPKSLRDRAATSGNKR